MRRILLGIVLLIAMVPSARAMSEEEAIMLVFFGAYEDGQEFSHDALDPKSRSHLVRHANSWEIWPAEAYEQLKKRPDIKVDAFTTLEIQRVLPCIYALRGKGAYWLDNYEAIDVRLYTLAVRRWTVKADQGIPGFSIVSMVGQPAIFMGDVRDQGRVVPLREETWETDVAVEPARLETAIDVLRKACPEK